MPNSNLKKTDPKASALVVATIKDAKFTVELSTEPTDTGKCPKSEPSEEQPQQ